MTYRVAAGGGGSAQTAAAAAGMQLEPDWVSSSQLLKAVDVKPLYESIDEAKEMLRADFANGKCRQYRAASPRLPTPQHRTRATTVVQTLQ